MTLTYEAITQITQTLPFILVMIAVWLLPILLYLAIAGSIRARTTSGKKLSKPMISSVNSMIAPIIWFFFQGGLIVILLIFPVWAKLLN